MIAPRLTPFALTALLLAAPATSAQVIDTTQYLPLGSFNAWEMIDKASFDADGSKLEHQVISVTKTDVIAGVPRYNIRTKFFGNVANVLFQFGQDGDSLYLYGVRILLPTEFINDPDIKVSLPTIFFDQPVLVGTTATQLDVPMQTAVTAKFAVNIEIGDFFEESGFVFIDPGSTVTATWKPVAAPINTPLGTFGLEEGGNPLAELVLDFFFTYSSNNGDIDDEIADEVTDKSVGGIMGPGTGFVLIDGQGSQQKIVNRAVLPGDLLSNPADIDAFVDPPPGDVASISLPVESVYLLDFLLTEGDFSDGTVSLSNLALEHDLRGGLLMTASATAGIAGPADIQLKGKAKYNPKTGGLKVALAGQTKQLGDFAKTVKFKVKQELPVEVPAEGGFMLDVVYNAGKDPITKELITGTIQVPLSVFQVTQADLALNLPVDIPKIKKAQIFFNPVSRKLGAEGTLTLQGITEGPALVYPITLIEKAKVKEGFPTTRTYAVVETGTNKKLFNFKATSTNVDDFLLSAFKGKLANSKLATLLEEIAVVTQ